MKTILFYSSVKTKEMFSVQGFYRNDILSLQKLGYQVVLSNRFVDFFCFWKYSISFLYFYRYSCVPAFISKLFFKKVYFTGGIDYLDSNVATSKQRFIQAVFFKICNFFSDGSILVSSADVKNVRNLYKGKLPKNCSLNFHAIDVEAFTFTDDFSKKKNNYCTIAWMANIDNVFRKGVDKALNIFSEIAKTDSDAMFYIAGMEGEGSKYILQQMNRLSFQNRVVYLGTISEEEKIRILKESKYYFQLSKYEGFGIAAIEALAAGCLVIHSGRGGLKDAVGEYGYVVDIENPMPTETLLPEIKEKSADYESLKNGIQYVREMFSIQQRIDFFSKVINDKKTI